MSTRSRLVFWTICTILLIFAGVASGCTSAPASPAPAASPVPAEGGNAITIKNFAFSPASLTVKSGTTVTWTNQDSVPHIVASDTGSPAAFTSDSLSTGDSYTFTFTQAGEYTYHCSIHPSMKGTIVVQ
jgi:plastocyanin